MSYPLNCGPALRRMCLAGLITLGLVGFATITLAQQKPVVGGKGSYAPTPPPELLNNGGFGKALRDRINKKYDIVDLAGRPVPTNHWYTNIIEEPFAGQMWPYPLKLNSNLNGLTLQSDTEWEADGHALKGGSNIELRGSPNFRKDSLVRWGDWTITFRMESSDTQWVDVTVGRGLPTAWMEVTGASSLVIRTTTNGQPRTVAGRSVKFPFTGDNLLMNHDGRWWGYFAPAGTRFEMTNDLLKVTFAGKDKYLSVAPLPDVSMAQTFFDHAYAVPRDSRVDWELDKASWTMKTTWTLTTEALRGDNKQVIQGWLPHHLMHNTIDFKLIEKKMYLSPRGPVRLAVGDVFGITWPAPNVLYDLPMPAGAKTLDRSRMNAYLETFAREHTSKPEDYHNNTYWGGKVLEHDAQMALIAQRLNSPTFKTHAGQLKAALADWLTWTPGEKEFFFTAYPGTGALIGFPPAYGSESFTDNHFHFGYFTAAGGMLATVDPQFAKDFGPMLKLVARQYANWDREDKNFPFMRTFDLWAGHSYAGGTSGAAGNNQESTSESINAWMGIVMLGQVLHDAKMTDAGLMGYAMESQATLDYWFNASGESWGPTWKKPNVGILEDWGNVYGTFFGAEPEWIYGIQMIPSTPALDIHATDPAAAQATLDAMLHERTTKGKGGKLSDLDGEWACLILAQQARINPALGLKLFNQMYAANNNTIRNDTIAGITYYQIAAYAALGRRDLSLRTDAPMSGVYRDMATGKVTVAVYNPGDVPMTVRVLSDKGQVGTVSAPAGLLSAMPMDLPADATPAAKADK